MDLDQLADTIADRLSEHIISSFKVDSIVTVLLEKHGKELEDLMTSAIVERM